MRLWTFQSSAVAEKLQTQEHRGDYSKLDPTKKPYYDWMARVMTSRGIPIGDNPPIWAWRPGGKVARPPRLMTARAFVSDADLMYGVYTVEFDAPENLILLSSYSHWCDIYFEPASELPTEVPPELLAINPNEDDDDFQACLPYIRPEWVLSIRKLNLSVGEKVGDETRCI